MSRNCSRIVFLFSPRLGLSLHLTKTATMMQKVENHLWISHASYELLAFPNITNYIDTKYTTRKIHTNLHPGPLMRVLHFLTSEDTYDVISHGCLFSTVLYKAAALMRAISVLFFGSVLKENHFHTICTTVDEPFSPWKLVNNHAPLRRTTSYYHISSISSKILIFSY